MMRSIVETGLLLVPEVIKVPGERRKDGSSGEPLFAVQKRFCLTWLPKQEQTLEEHQRVFGPFSLAFDLPAVLSLGATPVFYLPEPTNDDDSPVRDYPYFLLHRLHEIGDLLQNMLDLEKMRAEFPHRLPLADSVSGESFQFDSRSLGFLIRHGFLGSTDDSHSATDRLSDMLAAVRGVSSLFYPAYSQRHLDSGASERHFYFAQREWRVISSISVLGERLDRQLSDDEKQRVFDLDPDFFGRRYIPNELIIDGCRLIDRVGGRHISEFIRDIRGPAEASDSLMAIRRELLGDRRPGCFDA